MKIVVITRHAVSNYGSLLQAMATQQVIENMGHTCEIIDYVRKDESYFWHEITLLKHKVEWNLNPIKRILYLCVRLPESILAGKKFEKAQKYYLKKTQRYSTEQELMAQKPNADIYMTGSDQVWGPVENGTYDSVYCLSFTADTDKKIAYAASFGHTDMTIQLENYFKQWLSRYQYLSVREDSALTLLDKIGLKSKQVLDPTLLFDSTFWSKYTKPIKEKNYILVYQLHNDKRLGNYAKEVAKKYSLSLIRVSSTLHQILREGKFIWCPDIGEFLSYIKNAKCLITDSFHGTAFAINFNTPFVEILPNNKTGTRNMSILKMTGLSNRILKNDDDIALAEQKIDFSKVNQIIDTKRKESLTVLKYMIEN